MTYVLSGTHWVSVLSCLSGKKSRTHDIFGMKHKGDKVEEGTGTMTEAKCQGSENKKEERTTNAGRNDRRIKIKCVVLF